MPHLEIYFQVDNQDKEAFLYLVIKVLRYVLIKEDFELQIYYYNLIAIAENYHSELKKDFEQFVLYLLLNFLLLEVYFVECFDCLKTLLIL